MLCMISRVLNIDNPKTANLRDWPLCLCPGGFLIEFLRQLPTFTDVEAKVVADSMRVFDRKQQQAESGFESNALLEKTSILFILVAPLSLIVQPIPSPKSPPLPVGHVDVCLG